MAKIYVSSTFNDLQEYREQVRISLRSMGHEDIAMEYYTAGEQRPVDKCLADVAASDIYVGIFAFRYGYVPNGQGKSVTEQEYRKAIELNKPCFIFMLKDDAPWPPNRFEFSQIATITAFRKELCDKHIVGMFTDKNDLAKQVTAAIYNWALEHGHVPATVPTIPQFDLEKYYEALRKRYGALALEGLTPPQKEEYLQLQLRSVFVEQSVRENPPPVELPKEVWEKLSRDKEIHTEDLPSGITLDDIRKARESYYEKPSRPVLDVLTDSSYQYTIILGDPGSGKSTLARYIMLSLIDATGDEKLQRSFDAHLPLLIELRSYVGLCTEGHCKTFIEFLEYLGKTEGWALTQAALHDHLKNNGHAVVIFDGLDEIFEPEQREQFTRQIVGFCNDYSKARVIVTSRVIGYRRKILTDAGFTHFTLQDLNEKQVESFITRWYDLALSDQTDEVKERCERILKSFNASASIRQLAGNPMLLTIMAIIGKHQELPRERWKLYDHAASVLIQHWDVNKHLKDKSIEADFMGEDDKKELLRRLAFRMQSGDGRLAGNHIHHDGLQDEFESYLIERYSQTPDRAKIIAQAMIQQFRERNFILSLYGANLYGFVHRAFLEFFCAAAFVWKFEKTKDLTVEELKIDIYGKHWEDQSWHEVLRLICGMIDEKWAGKIIDYLAHDVYYSWPRKLGKRLPWNIALAIQCLGEVRNVVPIQKIGRNTVEKALNLMAGAREDRGQGISVFFETTLAPSFTSIERWLLHRDLSNWIYRVVANSFPDRSYYYACSVVATLCAQSDKELLMRIDTLARRNEPWLRYFFVETVAKMSPSDPASLSLLTMLKVENDTTVINSIVTTLVRHFHANIPTLSILRDRADKYEDWNVRSAVASALAEYYHEDPETLPLLRKATQDENEYVRSAAISALVEHYRENPDTMTILRNAVQDEHEDVRSAAASALAQYYREDPGTLPLLRKAMQDKNEYVRSSAISALAEYYREDPETLPLLHEAAQDKHEVVRSAAMSALAQYYREDPETLPLLHEAAQDKHEDVRSAAISALVEHYRENPETLPLLHEAAQDKHVNVRSAAISALVEYYSKNPDTMPLLHEAAQDKHVNVRSAAVSALVEYYRENPGTLPILHEAAHDKHEDVRSSAISALAEYYREDPDTMPLLRESIIKDEKANVRYAAVSALAQYYREEPETLPLLREWIAKSKHQDVRNAAVSALAQYYHEDPETMPLLRESIIKDEKANVRYAAVSALAQYYREEPETLPLLREWIAKSKHQDVRNAAVSALVEYYREDPETLPLLHEAAQDKNEYVRSSAISALAQYYREDPETLPLLHEAAQDKYVNVRGVAVSALVEHYRENPEAMPLFLEWIAKSKHEDVRSAAVSALAEYYRKNPETLPLLHEAAQDKHEDVRSAAVSALAEYYREDPETLPLLHEAAQDKHEDVRNAAVSALVEYYREDPETLPLLLERVSKDEGAEVRRVAISALAEHYRDGEMTLSSLYERARNDSSPTAADQNDKYYPREVAIEALAKNWPKHPNTLILLHDCAENDPTPWLRERAKELIKELEEEG